MRPRMTRSSRRLRTSVGLPLVLMLSVACGSTVQSTGAASLTGPGVAVGGDGLSVPGSVAEDGLTGSLSGGDAAPGTTSGGTPLAGSSSIGGSSGRESGSSTSAGATGTPGSATTSGAGSAAASGKVPGIENGVIKIGMIRTTNAEAAYTAIGASELAGSGYGDRMVEALVQEINRTGIKGLKIKIVNYNRDLTDSSTPPAVHEQRACAAWTEDDRVFAALTGEGEVMDACLAKAGVLQVCGNCAISTYDNKQMNAVPLLFSPNGVLVNRQVEFYVKGPGRGRLLHRSRQSSARTAKAGPHHLRRPGPQAAGAATGSRAEEADRSDLRRERVPSRARWG